MAWPSLELGLIILASFGALAISMFAEEETDFLVELLSMVEFSSRKDILYSMPYLTHGTVGCGRHIVESCSQNETSSSMSTRGRPSFSICPVVSHTWSALC